MNNITKDGKVWLLTTFVRSLKGHRESSSSSSGSYQSVMKMWTLPSLRSSFSHRRPGRFDLPPLPLFTTQRPHPDSRLSEMYESVDVVGLSPSPSSPSTGSFLSMDYYHRPPGLGPEKGLLSVVGGLQRPFGGSLLTGRHWSGSSHCEWDKDYLSCWSFTQSAASSAIDP